MTLNKIASIIAKHEGKKSQARIGDIREILKIIVTLSSQLDDRVDIAHKISVLADVAFDKNVAKRSKKLLKK